MTQWRIILILTTLLAGFTPLPAFTQSSAEGLAEELNLLRQERRQLEKDIDLYETSIELLHASGKDQASVQPKVNKLESQLKKSHKQLMVDIEREAEILDLLPRQTRSSDPLTRSSLEDIEAAEVAHLKDLINAHDTRAAAAHTANLEKDATEEDPVLAGGKSGVYTVDKVRLNGIEGVAEIERINRRLADASTSAQRREPDIIFHVDIRQDGTLRSSRSYNLKALGRSQYVAKVSLMAGSGVVSVRRDEWSVKLGEQEVGDYLITLNLPRGAKPELHVIPVDEIQATAWTKVPPWLPQIGIVATAPDS